MANSQFYDNVMWPGADGLRVPQERSGIRSIPVSLQTYSEADLGTVSSSPLVLTAQQAGASLITVNPTVALVIQFPFCQFGQQTLVQNLNATNAVSVQVVGNSANVATVAVSSLAHVVQTGTNGGVALVSGT